MARGQAVSLRAGVLVAFVSAVPLMGHATDRTSVRRTVPPSLGALKLAAPLERGGVSSDPLHDSLARARGPQHVVVRLRTPEVGKVDPDDALGQRARLGELQAEQEGFLHRLLASAPSARVLARTRLVLNAVFLEIDAADLRTLARDPDVLQIAPVADYQRMLAETVPYIGASSVQALGIDGTGVRVAVLDSGIDYLHFDLGGAGDPEEYAANDPAIVEPGSFPTAKVVGGFDFVGGLWPLGPLAPDPDPLDDGPDGGHGTHVADIIGGRRGVAPGASLYAVKVCSSVTTSCSGVAIVQGLELAVDPDGDGSPDDHVDLVNMSLGGDYGQTFDDFLVLAVDNAAKLGVLTVAASGNAGDKPFVTSTPAAARSALSVAQTQVPSASLPFMTVVLPATFAGDYPAILQPWSAPVAGVIERPVQYGDGAGGNLDGCAPFTPGSLAGKLVAVDRGTCFFSDKIRNIQEAGGILGVIALVAPGEPFAGGFGGGSPITIPGYMVSQETGDILRAGDAYVRFDPDNRLELIGSLVGTSSRGPRFDDLLVKPEIGAPGASVSAVYGTGTATSPFGGTSGATPMVTGAAALLLQGMGEIDRRHHLDARSPYLTPLEAKAMLMNYADVDIRRTGGGELAEVSRIGGGEVRIDRSVAAPAAAWVVGDGVPSLSFGAMDVAHRVVEATKYVRIRNYSDRDLEYRLHAVFRYANDMENGAVRFRFPSTVRVKAGREGLVPVKLVVDGTRVRENALSSGPEGGNPAALTLDEYDGSLVLDGGGHTLHLPWHVLPRRAAELEADRRKLRIADGTDRIELENEGVGTAQNDAYALLALSPDLPEGAPGEEQPTPDVRAVGIKTVPVPAGICSEAPSFVWAFAVNAWERRTHLLPVSYQFWLDIDRDGIADFVVLNRDFSVFATGDLGAVDDGRQVSIAFDLNAGTLSAFFFAEHATSTGNTVLYVCAEQVGLDAADLLTTAVDMDVVAQDFYFGGPGDAVEGLTVTPLGERFFAEVDDIPGRGRGTLEIVDFDPLPGNTAELGVLLFSNGDRGTLHRGGATEKTEALLFVLPGVRVPERLDTDDHGEYEDGNSLAQLGVD